MVIYLKTDSISAPPRFGFVVSKSVGSAVDRNLIKRRLRSAIRNSLKSFQNGQNLVIRALPGVKFKTWTELETEISESVAQAAKRGHDPDLLIK
jgi:ribonuclease P protein component